MKIDLHVHCRDRSPCGTSTEDEQIQAAIQSGLDALVFTDHDCLIPADHLAALNRRYAPFHIFGGIEITLPGEHVLVVGVQDPALTSKRWTYPDLWRFVREKHGFLALAHPYRFHNRIEADIERFAPHAMEVYSTNTPKQKEADIRTVAARLGIPLVSDSDAHSVVPLGRFYNILEQDPEDEKALVEALRAGAFTACLGN